MNVDLARKRARQQHSPAHPLRLDPSWETNPELTILLWTCQTCEGLSLPPPWLKQTNERCAAGKPTKHTGTQELDRCWSGTGLESPVSDFALSLPAPADKDKDKDLKQNVQASMRWVNRTGQRVTHGQSCTSTLRTVMFVMPAFHSSLLCMYAAHDAVRARQVGGTEM